MIPAIKPSRILTHSKNGCIIWLGTANYIGTVTRLAVSLPVRRKNTE